MKLQEFLAKLKQESSVTIVGPLHGQKLDAEQPTIFVDGGTHFRGAAGLHPEVSVGDGDSFPKPLDVSLPADKDFSDLAYVLQQLPSSITEIEMLGFLGGRRDHELAVLGEMHSFLLSRGRATEVSFFDQGKLKIVAASDGEVDLTITGIFSVFVFKESEVTIQGACKYPLVTPTLLMPLSSLGLSNLGEGFVKIKSSGPCFVILN